MVWRYLALIGFLICGIEAIAQDTIVYESVMKLKRNQYLLQGIYELYPDGTLKDRYWGCFSGDNDGTYLWKGDTLEITIIGQRRMEDGSFEPYVFRAYSFLRIDEELFWLNDKNKVEKRRKGDRSMRLRYRIFGYKMEYRKLDYAEYKRNSFYGHN